MLSVREHFRNREGETGEPRIFINGRGRGWVATDVRPPVPAADRDRLIGALDAEMRRRLPAPARLLLDPGILDVALPLSGRATAAGLGVLPRGSLSKVDGEQLRFFVYWKETGHRTDYDLSALLLHADYRTDAWLSCTSLTAVGGEHSGDVTEAPDGASEFINLSLDRVRSAFIVPQVNVFDGEGFEEAEESFFGFMLRDGEQKGRPFEPRTVRMKSELRISWHGRDAVCVSGIAPSVAACGPVDFRDAFRKGPCSCVRLSCHPVRSGSVTRRPSSAARHGRFATTTRSGCSPSPSGAAMAAAATGTRT